MLATPKKGIARSPLLRTGGANPTMPSLPRNPPRTTGPQGSPGGVRQPRPGRQRGQLAAGDEIYLWALVLIEVFAIGGLRRVFRRYHGG